MIPEKVEKLLKDAKPFEEPKIKQRITRSCANCMDYIVCWAEGKFDEDPDEDENKEAAQKAYENHAKDCPDWHLDFMTYQKMIEDQEK